MKLPQEFLSRMKEVLKEEYSSFLASYDQPAVKALRRNPLKMDQLAFEEKFSFLEKQVPWCSLGYYYDQREKPGVHPFHQAGLYYLQEPSAMAVAEHLAVRPGERILDLCAAPGGKSSQIGCYLKGEGILVCNEPHPARVKVLSENIERMGIGNALVTSEPPYRLAQKFPDYFDQILVDAPCSGEGMFRKNEEAIAEWSLENVQICAKRQAEILDEAAKMLRPGGRLVYSTCTFSREENEECIEKFLQRHSEFSFVEEKRLWPHRIVGEGHYLAVLIRKDGEEKEEAQPFQGGMLTLLPGNTCKEFWEFGQQTIRDFTRREWRLHLFGDQVYHLPKDTPSLTGLKVLRPGLHLGTLKKNRFEPAHALALALPAQQFFSTYNLGSEEKAVRDYLSGNTFFAEGKKGWCLLTVDGYGLGWGKLAGGVMKNHYPKGLRRMGI